MTFIKTNYIETQLLNYHASSSRGRGEDNYHNNTVSIVSHLQCILFQHIKIFFCILEDVCTVKQHGTFNINTEDKESEST